MNAVLAAAGHRAPARREWPGGLTAREVEALFRRRFRRTPKGLLGYLLNRLAGRQIHGSALRHTLEAIEAG